MVNSLVRILRQGAIIGLGGGGLLLQTFGQAPDYAAFAELKTPPLSPQKALETFELEEGFRIEAVAHEPMVLDPVAMDIDADGRLWVVEMTSYMPVHDKNEMETSALERVPQGRVVVLEDTTGDGKMDTSRTFYEKLVLPRAIKVLDDGILIGEPPNVWFIQDTNGDGQGDRRELVYDSYGDPTSDNVEHMPNGLMWGMDNWLHSSHNRVESLRRVAGEWQTRPFQTLGQWGMTQDDWGRLYSTSNSRLLQTHLVPHGYSERHPLFQMKSGKNQNIGANEVWPAHPTGVNRGYREGLLRDDGTLSVITAVSGAVIYRGDQFGREYRGNAFVPEPAGNLIKRLIIDGDPGEIEARARFAYEGREFLTSTDERFRPVNLYNAPDGSIYVIDMYRGIFQHARFLTDYLRDYAVAKDLHKPEASFGRIYRIVREDRKINYEVPELSQKTPLELVGYLRHENGLLRDLAQQLLVQRSPVEAVPALQATALNVSEPAYTRLHALWVLDGFERSAFDLASLTELARKKLGDDHPRVRAAAIRILEPAIASGSKGLLALLEQMRRDETSEYVQLQLLASLGESTEDRALLSMARILDQHVDQPAFREMALTGVYRREAQMAEILRRSPEWRVASDENRQSVLQSLAEAGAALEAKEAEPVSEEERIVLEQGEHQYRTCMACHGEQGDGQEGVAPRLAGSGWVTGDVRALARIVLHGFESENNDGPGVMPAHGYLSDENIAAVLTFIRQAWGNEAAPVAPAEVGAIREKTQTRRGTWSNDELRALLESGTSARTD